MCHDTVMQCSLWVYFSWILLSVWVFLSFFLSFFFLFSLSDTFKQKHISKSSERGTLLFLSLSLVLLSSFALYFSFLSHSLMSWFPSFSLFCVQCKHDLCLTRSHWTFMKLGVIDVYILNCLFFLSVRKGMCLNGIKCDCSFTAIHFSTEWIHFFPLSKLYFLWAMWNVQTRSSGLFVAA